MKKIENIMYYLDYWVKQHGRYVDPHEVPDKASNSLKIGHIIKAHQLGIQQVRSEIKEFVEVILKRGLNKRVLEIGLGYYGGTHMLWRQLFDEVITVEYSHPVMWKFKLRERVNGKSKIIMGNSHNLKVRQKVKLFRPFDLLFIDGDHTYSGIKADYLLYNSLVKKGGVVAFHDSVCKIDGFGIAEFLHDLESGKIDNNLHEVNQIVYSDYVGIAYIER
jgi:hypothetical protein